MTKQDHLLVILAEEAGEIAQAATKILRFGIDSRTNRQDLINEVNDLVAMVQMLQSDGILPDEVFQDEKIDAKKVRVEKYLEYSKTVGRLE